MKKTIMAGILLIAFASLSFAQQVKEVPITTSSMEARGFFVKGLDKFDNIEFSAAARLFDQAIAKDSNFALAYCYRAFSGGGNQVLNSNLDKAISLMGKVSEGEKLLISLFKANVDANVPKQKEYLDKLVKEYPEDKRIAVYMGSYYQGIEDYKTAIEYFTKATEIDKDYAPAFNFLGYADIAAGDLAAAEKALKEYIRLVPGSPNPYDSYAELLLKIGRYDESIAQYQKAVDIDNSFVSSLNGIGHDYLFKGDYAKAREYYQKTYDRTTLVGEKLGALYFKALSFMYENKPADAIKAFEERRLLAEKEKQANAVVYTIAFEGVVLTELGNAADGMKKYEDAISAIDKAELTSRQKENLRVYSNNWRAYAFAMNNMLDKAQASIDLYKKDVEARNNPDEKKGLETTLAIIDFKKGNYDAAIDRLSKLDPDPWILYFQAQSLIQKGDKDGAKKLLTKIVNWNQNNLMLAAVWSHAKSALAKVSGKID